MLTTVATIEGLISLLYYLSVKLVYIRDKDSIINVKKTIFYLVVYKFNLKLITTIYKVIRDIIEAINFSFNKLFKYSIFLLSITITYSL